MTFWWFRFTVSRSSSPFRYSAKKSYVFIFYTGKRELALPCNLPVNVFIFNCRPHLEHILTGIVASIHSGDGLPETLFAEQQKLASSPFHERMKIALSRVFETYDYQEMFMYAVEETAKLAALGDLESAGTSSTDSPSLNDASIEKAPVSPNLSDLHEGQVSVKGLDAMIVKFLGGIGEYSNSEMVELFQKIDNDGSGFIDQTEFDEFVTLATYDEFKRKWTAWQQEAKTKVVDKSTVQVSRSSLVQRSTRRLSDGTSESESMIETITEHNTVGSISHHLAQTGRFKSVLGDEGTIKYVKTIADNTDGSGNPLEDWSVFYCGGSNKIKADLKDISRKYGIDFAVEKFDW